MAFTAAHHKPDHNDSMQNQKQHIQLMQLQTQQHTSLITLLTELQKNVQQGSTAQPSNTSQTTNQTAGSNTQFQPLGSNTAPTGNTRNTGNSQRPPKAT